MVAANLRCKLLQLHQHLRDPAASRRMVHTLLDLAHTLEQPAARLPLLRMAMAANQQALDDETKALTASSYLDEGLACAVWLLVWWIEFHEYKSSPCNVLRRCGPSQTLTSPLGMPWLPATLRTLHGH